MSLTIPVVLPLLNNSWRESFPVGRAGGADRARNHAARPPSRRERAIEGAAALVAGLERSDDLAAWHRTRQRERNVLQRQRLPARLSASHRPSGPGQRSPDRAERRTDPASFLLLAVAGRLERKRWPLVACGAGSLAAILGIVLSPGYGIVWSAGVLGFLRPEF